MTETLRAVGGLWELALVLLCAWVVLRHPKAIGSRLSQGGLRLRRGDTSVEIDPLPPEPHPQNALEGAEEEPPSQLEAGEDEESPRGDEAGTIPDADVSDGDDASTNWRRHITNRDLIAAEAAFRAEQERLTDPDARLAQEAYYYYHLANRSNDPTALHRLERLLDRTNDASHVNYFLGLTFKHANDYPRALQAFERAYDLAETDRRRSHCDVRIAETLHASGDSAGALERLTAGLADAPSVDIASRYYGGVADFYDREQDPLLSAIALEKALEGAPNDTSKRFDAAYRYAETAFRDLAASHYANLLEYEPTESGALNNLGVQFERRDVPIEAVRYYRRAAEHGNTLAMANLAYRQIRGGFAREAETTLDEARASSNVHPNVGGAIAELASRREAASASARSLIQAGEYAQRFMRLYADARFKPRADSPRFAGVWEVSPEHEVQVIQADNLVTVNWETPSGRRYVQGPVTNHSVFGMEIQEYAPTAGVTLPATAVGLCLVFWDVERDQIEILHAAGELRHEILTRQPSQRE